MLGSGVRLKQRLDASACLLGGFVFSTDPGIAEIYAQAGFDFVVIDLEHALNDLRSVQAHLRACAAAGIEAVVRLGSGSLADAPRLLDAGAQGVMLPHVGMPGAASDELLRSLRYAPMGSRPTCTGVQAAGYGLADFAAAAERANREVLAIGLIEDAECVERVGELLARSRLDWVMPGPGDLAMSLGVPGQLTHPRVQQAVQKVLEAAQRHGVPAGMYVNDPSEVPAWRQRGVRFVVYSIDYKVLARSLQQAAAACRAVF